MGLLSAGRHLMHLSGLPHLLRVPPSECPAAP
jgi:hypothetical protein